MSKLVKGILVDSKNEKVTPITFDGEYYSVHELLGKEVNNIDWVTFPNGDIIYFDMEQDLYNRKSKGFQFDSGMCRYGNCLIVGGVNKSETHMNVKTKITNVKKGTTFGQIRSVNQVV